MSDQPEGRYTAQELMVTAAAREIRDGELVFVGMRLPILAYGVARSNHAPTARAPFAAGLMPAAPAPALLATTADPTNVAGGPRGPAMSHGLGQAPAAPLKRRS